MQLALHERSAAVRGRVTRAIAAEALGFKSTVTVTLLLAGASASLLPVASGEAAPPAVEEVQAQPIVEAGPVTPESVGTVWSTVGGDHAGNVTACQRRVATRAATHGLDTAEQ